MDGVNRGLAGDANDKEGLVPSSMNGRLSSAEHKDCWRIVGDVLVCISLLIGDTVATGAVKAGLAW